MKTLLSVISALIIVSLNYAQETLELKFSINQNSNYLKLDSILIENTTISVDTTIYYPDNSLSLDIISGIIPIKSNNQFEVSQNYPNPFENKTSIDVYVPDNDYLTIQIFDNTGRMLDYFEKNLNSGEHTFSFYPGQQQNYILNFKSGNKEKSIKLLHTGSGKNRCKIVYEDNFIQNKIRSGKMSHFSYSFGDNLRFTGFVTACSLTEIVEITDSPTTSVEYFFDFTHLTDTPPAPPEIIGITATESSILWEWTDVENVNGYKYNTINEYHTAIDNEMNTSLMQTDLTAGTNYELFVWAHNDCEESSYLQMNKATDALPLTQDEIDLILDGNSDSEMTIMNIFEQPDSVILRTKSTNVILEEEHLDYLANRMLVTVQGTGIGIAAPQVGINRRIIWVQRHDKGTMFNRPFEIYYNPRITRYSDTVAYRNDGCLSVPTGGEYPETEGFSYRAIWVEVEYYDESGNYNKEVISQPLTAHIFQHEIDHLDGIMFFDLQEVEKKIRNFVIIEADPYDVLKD